MLTLDVCHMRRVQSHRREVFSSGVIWPVLLGHVVLYLMIARSGRRSGSSRFWDIDNQGFFDCLSTWEVVVEGTPNGLFRPQDALIAQ